MRSRLRYIGCQLFIGFLLVAQAAHQPSAGSGNFCRIEGKILQFCHFRAHRLEGIQKHAAAVRAAAQSDSAQQFGFVPDTNLPQFNAIVKHTGKILDQFSKIHPPIRGKEKGGFGPFKIAFHVEKLHFKAMGGDLLFSDLKCFLFLLPIAPVLLQVLLCCHALYRPQRHNHLPVIHLMVSLYAIGDFQALRRFHNQLKAVLRGNPVRRKIIGFPLIFEFNTDNFNHS